MKLSIIIPSYNSYSSTLKLIKTFDKKQLKDVEIIIVNDSSTEKYGPFPKWVNYISLPKNQGAVNARKVGWDKSTGKYVWFFDCDDQIMNNAIKIINDHLSGKDLYVFKMLKEKSNKKFKVAHQKIKTNDISSLGYSSYFGDKIFKSSVINKEMFDLNSEIFQDENFIMRFGAKAKSVVYYKNLKPVSCYLYNFNSISKREITFEQVYKLINNVKSLIDFVNALPQGKFKVKCRKQLTRMITIAKGWTLKLNSANRKIILKEIKLLVKKHKSFGFILNYSFASILISFISFFI